MKRRILFFLFFLLWGSRGFGFSVDYNWDYRNYYTKGDNIFWDIRNSLRISRNGTEIKLERIDAHYHWKKEYVTNRMFFDVNIKPQERWQLLGRTEIGNLKTVVGYPFIYGLSYRLRNMKVFYNFQKKEVEVNVATVSTPLFLNFYINRELMGFSFSKYFAIRRYRIASSPGSSFFSTRFFSDIVRTDMKFSERNIKYYAQALIGLGNFLVAGDSHIIDIKNTRFLLFSTGIGLGKKLKLNVFYRRGEFMTYGTLDLRDYLNTEGFFLIEPILERYKVPVELEYNMDIYITEGSLYYNHHWKNLKLKYAFSIYNIDVSSAGSLTNEEQNISYSFCFPYSYMMIGKLYVKAEYRTKRVRFIFYVKQFFPVYMKESGAGSEAAESQTTESLGQVFGGHFSGMRVSYVF